MTLPLDNRMHKDYSGSGQSGECMHITSISDATTEDSINFTNFADAISASVLTAREPHWNESTTSVAEIYSADAPPRWQIYSTPVPQLHDQKFRQHAKIMQQVMNDRGILVGSILPYVGVGQFAFVGGVSRSLRDSYKQYVHIVQDLPLVTQAPYPTRPTASTDTFYSAVCASVSCAEHYCTTTNENDKLSDGISTVAAKLGSLPILQWAHAKQLPWDCQTCSAAAKNGHLEVLKRAHENGCPWDWTTCSEAAKSGHLEVLKWAHNNGAPLNPRTTCWKIATVRGHSEVCGYFLQQSLRDMIGKVEEIKREMVQQMDEMKIPFQGLIFLVAVYGSVLVWRQFIGQFIFK